MKFSKMKKYVISLQLALCKFVNFKDYVSQAFPVDICLNKLCYIILENVNRKQSKVKD